MHKTVKAHLDAITAGTVDRSVVIGLRKAINTAERKAAGWSIGRTAPKASLDDVARLEGALAEHKPRVAGELHESGLKVLRNRRYAKRLAPLADIIADVVEFRLIGFDRIGRHGAYSVPVYAAIASDGRRFAFRNVPWQSGGDGPEIVNSHRA